MRRKAPFWVPCRMARKGSAGAIKQGQAQVKPTRMRRLYLCTEGDSNSHAGTGTTPSK